MRQIEKGEGVRETERENKTKKKGLKRTKKCLIFVRKEKKLEE